MDALVFGLAALVGLHTLSYICLYPVMCLP